MSKIVVKNDSGEYEQILNPHNSRGVSYEEEEDSTGNEEYGRWDYRLYYEYFDWSIDRDTNSMLTLYSCGLHGYSKYTITRVGG